MQLLGLVQQHSILTFSKCLAARRSICMQPEQAITYEK